jgi:hypothetical protein
MDQVFIKAGSELLRGQLHAAQHPFDDVAVVAEQASGLAAVVTMIRPNLPAFKIASANSAAVGLNNKEAFHLRPSQARPCTALSVNDLRPSDRVGSEFGVSSLPHFLRFGGSVELAAALSGFRRVATLLATRLHLRSLVVFSFSRSDFIPSFETALAMPLKVIGPLFRGAVSFFHAADGTRHSGTLNRAVA